MISSETKSQSIDDEQWIKKIIIIKIKKKEKNGDVNTRHWYVLQITNQGQKED